MKTENPAHVDKHAFEVAGLGKAPFRFTGVTENVFIACQGAPAKAGGCCDYCFTGIRYEFHIMSADGKASKVGCDCINKVGDEGLMRAYKSSSAFRKLQRDKRIAKGAEARKAIKEMIEANKDKLAATPHPRGFTDRLTGRAMTLLDEVEWMLSNCGISGTISYRKTLAKLIEKL